MLSILVRRMSSEDKSLDPSDHGPSTPLSITGGCTPSPAPTDRRPRGRPRKDAGSGLPTPRKKGRSRGRAQVEDEDSMDGTETAEAENMQDMEVKELVLDVEEEIMVPSPRTTDPSPHSSSAPCRRTLQDPPPRPWSTPKS
ncbi:histone-lysine N-methyltransferase 2C-like, partial [Oncorhynchus mykiss]|uniref:histone-lysine N-methyltransferase 2C-like n=1 Tax=Oncorhynchus mykiss TaxID=8022 RepID=UPI00187808F0